MVAADYIDHTGRQGVITRLGSAGTKLGQLGAYTIQQCQRINLFASGAKKKVGGSGRGSPCHMGKIGVCAWRFSARLFHYVHPLVLANVMHECTYRTLASHADTCRLDFYEIGRAYTFHKGNFLAPACGGGAMVGARFINSIIADGSPMYMLN